MKSVRRQLIEHFPAPPDAVGAVDQLEHALYFMLWDLDDPDVSVDGWMIFKVTSETAVSLEAVGLMTRLHGCSIPMSLRVELRAGGLAWNARASLKDRAWLSLSESRRWDSVYLFAGAEIAEPPWAWDRFYTGVLPKAEPKQSRERR